MDSRALRILAGELHPDVGELERLFAKGLEELKIERPSHSEAMIVAAKYYATGIVSGDMTPREASGNLWGLSCEDDAPECLGVFAGLASEYDDFEHRAQGDPEARQILCEIEKQILLAARSLLIAVGSKSC